MAKGTAKARFNFLVHDVSRMRRTLFDQALKPFGITRAQWWALGNISRYSEIGVAQVELAQLLDTGKVSAGNLIDRLEEANLVRRQPDKTDRRLKRIFITDAGFAILDRIALVGAKLDKLVFAMADEKEVAAAAKLLDLVKSNIKQALATDVSELIGRDLLTAAGATKAKRDKEARDRSAQLSAPPR